jgi:ligand-binding sensor domain-containing protein
LKAAKAAEYNRGIRIAVAPSIVLCNLNLNIYYLSDVSLPNAISLQGIERPLMWRILTILVLLLLHTGVNAQSAKPYAFTHYSTANGLAANLVNFIRQDDKGFIWLATINGLQRFDGNKFLTFRSDPYNPSSIPTDNVPALYVDKQKRLWITATNNKVGIFHSTRFTFKEVPVPYKNGQQDYRYKYFIEMPGGELLLYEVRGDIYRYDEARQQFVADTKTLPLPAGWKPASISIDSISKKYWITTDSGLVVYNPAKRSISYRGHNIDNDPVINRYESLRNLLAIRTDLRNNIFFYQWLPQQDQALIHNYNRTTNSGTVYNLKTLLQLGYHELYGFLQQRNGRTWIYGMPVFAEWTTDRKSFLPVTAVYPPSRELGLNFQRVAATFEDVQGNIWLATDDGAYVFNPDAQIFQTYNLPSANTNNAIDASISSVLHTNSGNIFISSWETGLFNFDTDLQPIPLPKSLAAAQKQAIVWGMHQHSKTGKIWFTLQKGANAVMVYDPTTEQLEWVTDTAFNKRTVRQITEDSQGNLWFGTQGGLLIKWDHNKAVGNPAKGYTVILKANYNINKLYTGPKGYIWVATNGNGLFKIDPVQNKVVRHYTTNTTKDFQLLRNNITDLTLYNDATLVAVAGSVHLINLNTNKVSHLTTANGLPSNTAVSVQRDKEGVLWLGMTGGLCRAYLPNNTYRLYDRKDGISYDNFEQLGAFQLRDGRMLFATPKNFIVFNPSAIAAKVPAAPIITNFRVANQPLNIDSLMQAKRAVMAYDNSALTIEFSNLNFLRQNKLRYYYKLEGLDKEWKRADAMNQAVYSYIPPGKYTFLVKSENENGEFSQTATAFPIQIKPPFWKTALFYGLLSILLLILLFIVDNERIKRIRSIFQVRERIAVDLHKDFSDTLTDINLLSEMAKRKADKDPGLAKDYIDRISRQSRNMKESMNEMLWSIDPKHDSMEKLLLRMQEYTRNFEDAHKVEVQLKTASTIKTLHLDMRSRYELLQLYKEALNYTVYQFICSPILVTIEYTKPKLDVKMLAQCTETEQEDMLSHQHRKDMQKRADALNATLDIFSDKKTIEVRLQFVAT